MKLCKCGCGKETSGKKNYRTNRMVEYIHGHNPTKRMFGKKHSEKTKNMMSLIHKGKKHTNEYKNKMSEIRKGKGNPMWGRHNPSGFSKNHIPWNKNLKGKYRLQVTEKKLKSVKRGENHYKWKNEGLGYSGVHSWITKTYGKPQRCDKCGTEIAKRFEWDNISGNYKRDRNDWNRLCSKCHANKHKNWEKRWYTL